MRFRDYVLFERFETNYSDLIVVDIQPDYAGNINFKHDFVQFLKDTLDRGKRVVYFFNGDEGLGFTTTKDSIIHWLVEDFVRDEEQYEVIANLLYSRVSWQSKGYAFLRDWMDSGVPEASIIKTVRYMVMRRITDSRELSEEEREALGIREIDNQQVLFIPDISFGLLKSMSGSYICGGGQHECLREITLLMNALNLRYTLLRRFIY